MPGEIEIEIESDLFPLGLAYHPGEQLRFVISAPDLLATLRRAIRE